MISLEDRFLGCILGGIAAYNDKIVIQKTVTIINSLLYAENIDNISNKLNIKNNFINITENSDILIGIASIGLCLKNPFKATVKYVSMNNKNKYIYACSGFLAVLISEIIKYDNLENAIKKARIEVKKYCKIDNKLKRSFYNPCFPSKQKTGIILPSFMIGGSDIVCDAISISIYYSLFYKNNFEEIIEYASHANGNKNITISLVSNILGTLHGMDVIPKEWLDKLEYKNELIELIKKLLEKYKES